MIKKERVGKTGIVFNIQRFSIHDGPGIRTTVFLKGCPLECIWCSNPEAINTKLEIMVHNARCIHCGKCKEACTTGAIIFFDGNRDQRIDADKCNNCMDCVRACPTKTLECVGRYMTVQEVVREVRKDDLFYRNSGGGITVSGGEPLMQWKFTRDLLKACKEEGFQTALDTTGFASWEVLESILKYVNLVLYDIKHLEDSAHIKGTEVSNKLILENLKNTAKMTRTWLRFPVLPGFNDSRGHVEKVAQLGARVGVEKVSLLPYHEWGKSKYEKLGLTYRFAPARMISNDDLEELKKIFEEKGLEVTLKS